jgi:hypothetical protein
LAKRKVIELESYERPSKLWKSSDEDIQRGLNAINEFFAEFKSLDMGSLQSIEDVDRFRSKYAHLSEMPFVKEVLSEL